MAGPPTPAQSQAQDLSSLQKFNDDATVPHASADDEDHTKQEQDDDDLINQLLAGTAGGANDQLGDLEKFEGGADGVQKADDALDYGDISDDDLAADEEVEYGGGGAAGAPLTNGHAHAETGMQENGEADFGDLFGDDDNELDDLFGGGEDLPMHDADESQQPALNDEATQEDMDTQQLQQPKQESFEDDDGFFGDDGGSQIESVVTAKPQVAMPDEEDPDPAAREQARMFREARERAERLRMGGLDPDAQLPERTDTDQGLLDEFYPEFDREGGIPYYGDLFFRRRAHYMKKAPLKVPTKAQPTRPVLDLDADQERAFKLTSAPKARKRGNEEAGEGGVWFVQADERVGDMSDDNIDLASLHDDEMVGGVSIQDLRVLCEEWDSFSVKSVDSDYAAASGLADGMANSFEESAPKRRKTSMEGLFESIARDDYPLFDDPEALTAKLAKRIPLDLNDSHLLLDFPQPAARDASAQTSFGRRREQGGVSSAIHKKFNFSNDEEYERLVKENSIRGAVGNIPIEHSGPARRLQYPYYKTTLSHREQRNFHRPALHFTPNTRLNIDRKLEHRKIKDMRKQSTAQAFSETKDLTLADNSSMMLLEYSEEMPLMMSNFGMNSRVINYYRRKDENDKFRPKEDVGEPRVLQEKDQSPFVKFGFVDPGQTMPTIHNNLYRAPIFRHDSKPQDFLVVKRQTGVFGTNYHLRNIENLHVVGQQYPFLEVPGTHGRKVTSTQKARMKMIAFRIYAKKFKTRGRHPYVPHSVITLHFPGSDVAQNRSKMRELMQYNKDHGSWEPKVGDDRFLDMEVLRNEIKAEDICLIDSMQVGARQMQDAGFDTSQIDNEKDMDAGDSTTTQSLDAQLVHWRATKNFLAACGDNAMIALHGDGDPTGRGEALSFVKISMKGGFQALGASVADKIRGRDKADASGHRYNVRDQEDAYQAAIRHIWDAQTHSLSMAEAPDLDVEMDDNIDARIERNNSVRPTPSERRETAPGTPGYFPRQSDIDDSFSHVSGSRVSASDIRPDGYGGRGDRVLRITRTRKDEDGQTVSETTIIDDPVVARQYKKRHDARIAARREEELRLGLSAGTLTAATPGGGTSGLSAEERKAAELELMRLQKNMDRRKIREAQKAAKQRIKEGKEGGGVIVDEDGKVLPGQTQRKCANCGQLGHIKTNKKYVEFRCQNIYCKERQIWARILVDKDGKVKDEELTAEIEAMVFSKGEWRDPPKEQGKKATKARKCKAKGKEDTTRSALPDTSTFANAFDFK